jgi:hypothetical protein
MMTVAEMTCDLPCMEALWEANDAAEFEAVVASKGDGCWRRSASFRDCVDALMADAWSGPDGFPLENPSTYDLYLLISGEWPRSFCPNLFV